MKATPGEEPSTPTTNAQSQASVAADEVRIYPIEHAAARDLAPILMHLRGEGESITVDERTNSIIAFGDESLQNDIADLIAKLDVAVDEGGTADVRTIPLEHARANDDLAVILSNVLRDRGQNQLRIATDDSTNQLILRGSTRALEAAAALVQALDQPRKGESDSDLSFRIVWLASDTHASGDVPNDMGDVIAALEDIGITDLAVAAQTVVRVSESTSFTSSCSAQLKNAWDVEIEGRAHPSSSGKMRIGVAIRASQRVDQSQSSGPGQGAFHGRPERIEMMTTITTTDGHFVVLGAAPVKDMNSVFVIQAKAIN
jgi:flavodoxin